MSHDSNDNFPAARSVSRRRFIGQAALATFGLALSRFPAFAQGTTATTKWDADMELAVTVELAAPSGFRYNRPYVAVWIENASGKEVRTLSLWVETKGRGPRYIPELRRWYRSATNTDTLVDTVSAPTRNPGKYTLVWDGKDDKKAPLPQGEYTIFVETAREHGPYSLVSEKVTIGAKGFKKTLDGNNDISGVILEYREHA
ncbi:DUF2271 domain-containing protein [Deinococcus yavapaiensis]|uniref:Secreted protein n=1 Tax=Deinococcus yavapaiensis KR-236 TaxID=694435 RepID=A0A318SL20_9DEIO|nr:DUF2271 domain-containing protein [Deinococcus yavapaiensis]PYE53252.1 hypothetical protein DES52_10924 [Deinococcus yavapaiensis KR-236]